MRWGGSILVPFHMLTNCVCTEVLQYHGLMVGGSLSIRNDRQGFRGASTQLRHYFYRSYI